MPVGDVLVGDTGGNVKHDDTALSVDVVTIAETTKLLLTGGVPYVELDLSEVLVLVSIPSLLRKMERRRTVVKPRGWTSTPSVAMYFFSNSPVKWRLTKVVWFCSLAGCLFPTRGPCCCRRLMRKIGIVLSSTHLSSTTVTHKHELEGWDVPSSFGHGVWFVIAGLFAVVYGGLAWSEGLVLLCRGASRGRCFYG